MAGVECRGRTIALNYGLVTSGLYASGTSRLRHHVTSRLLTLQTSQLRFLGRLEQHGRRGQQLPVHLRRGQPLRHRLAVSLPCPHPSRALTLTTHTHSQPAQFAARQAAQDDARAPPPRRDQREGVLRSLHARLADRGRVAHGSLARTPHASFHPTRLTPPHTHHIHRTPPHTLTTHARTPHPAALICLTLHASVRCKWHVRRTASGT